MFRESGVDNYVPHGVVMLFRQYLVDVSCRAEAMRLSYLRAHQKDLRAECYQELKASVEKEDFKAGETDIGRRILLPSSYPGSPQNMHQN